VSEYQQYQEATADEDAEFDEEQEAEVDENWAAETIFVSSRSFQILFYFCTLLQYFLLFGYV
jgi:hypothetical protein